MRLGLESSQLDVPGVHLPAVGHLLLVGRPNLDLRLPLNDLLLGEPLLLLLNVLLDTGFQET